jgi:hypothetical protein
MLWRALALIALGAVLGSALTLARSGRSADVCPAREAPQCGAR